MFDATQAPSNPDEQMDYPGPAVSENDYNALLNELEEVHPANDGDVYLLDREMVTKPAPIFVLGTLDYSFLSRERKRVFEKRIGFWKAKEDVDQSLKGFLEANHYHFDLMTWTLNIDGAPVYALVPDGAFAKSLYGDFAGHYERLRAQDSQTAERLSVAGWVIGKIQLYSGQTIPVVKPVGWGLESWNTEDILSRAYGDIDDDQERQQLLQELEVFLRRIYYSLRNKGLEPTERAINFAATQAFVLGSEQFQSVFKETRELGLVFDSITVEKSDMSPHGADCWDVDLIFFRPTDQAGTAKRLYRFTIDIADVLPVTINEDQKWYVPSLPESL